MEYKRKQRALSDATKQKISMRLKGRKKSLSHAANISKGMENYCPLSFRTVDSVDYKKAMLMFYEQNNIAAFKQIFIEQYEFATKNYF